MSKKVYLALLSFFVLMPLKAYSEKFGLIESKPMFIIDQSFKEAYYQSLKEKPSIKINSTITKEAIQFSVSPPFKYQIIASKLIFSSPINLVEVFPDKPAQNFNHLNINPCFPSQCMQDGEKIKYDVFEFIISKISDGKKELKHPVIIRPDNHLQFSKIFHINWPLIDSIYLHNPVSHHFFTPSLYYFEKNFWEMTNDSSKLTYCVAYTERNSSLDIHKDCQEFSLISLKNSWKKLNNPFD